MAKSFEIKLSNEKIKPLLDKLKSWCDRGQLEPRNYEVLTKMITKCENYDDAISILEIATQSRKTGLFYRHQFEKIDTNKIHYLAEDKKMSFGNKGITNKLIIGDNYLALENLLVSYRGKIDVIYIDPPYGCNDMGEYADVNYENNISRDNLLSQLSPRLELARQLLKNNGTIFVSIDDKNYAYVKCLMDDIFEEKNFVESFIFTKNSGGSLSSTTLTRHEYVLCYCFNKNNHSIFWRKKDGYNQVVNLVKECKDQCLSISETEKKLRSYFKLHDELKGIKQYQNIEQQINGEWRIYRTLPITAPNNQFYDVIHPITHKVVKIPTRGWSWNKETMMNKIAAGRVVFGKDEKSGLGQKLYLDEAEFEHKRSTYQCDQAEGDRIIKSIFGKSVFPNPKPLSLLLYLLTDPQNKDALVLDFYAGSGTTGQAVLELNKEDNGNRKFILCTNEDKMNGKLIHGIGTDITYERLRRIMTGQSSDNSNFQWIKENDAYGQILKVYKIAEMENFKKEIFELINPLDYDYKCLSEKKKIEWICKNFEQTQKILEEKK